MSRPLVAPFAITRHWPSQLDDRMTTAQSLLVTRHLQRQSVAILSKPACIWRFDERDRNTGALHLIEWAPGRAELVREAAELCVEILCEREVGHHVKAPSRQDDLERGDEIGLRHAEV